MSLLTDALTDFDSKVYNRCVHSEIREVVKDFARGENFVAVGNLSLKSLSLVGQGDPGQYAYVFDRIDKKVFISVLISDEDFDLLDTRGKSGDIEVCVWGIKNRSENKLGKMQHCSCFTSLVRASLYMQKFDMY